MDRQATCNYCLGPTIPHGFTPMRVSNSVMVPQWCNNSLLVNITCQCLIKHPLSCTHTAGHAHTRNVVRSLPCGACIVPKQCVHVR